MEQAGNDSKSIDMAKLQASFEQAEYLLRNSWCLCKSLKMHDTAAQVADMVLDLECASKLIQKDRS